MPKPVKMISLQLKQGFSPVAMQSSGNAKFLVLSMASYSYLVSLVGIFLGLVILILLFDFCAIFQDPHLIY